jgi:hypothetical protein
MGINVIETRLSLAWVKAFDKDTLLPYLASSRRYQDEFDKAKAGTGRWLLPWTVGERQHFWQYYLGTSGTGDLANVDARTAWACLMGLRTPNCANVAAPPGVRITLEGYGFPHSVGVLATAFIRPTTPVPLSEMVDLARRCRGTQYDISWTGGGQPTHGSLDSLADALMDRLHQELLGQTPHGNPLSSPLTIATVVNATGPEALSDQGSSDELDQALARLCELGGGPGRPTHGSWLGDGSDPVRDRLTSIDRGRAIWMPKHFSDQPSTTFRVRALGCYHRNLSVATLQARSLTALLRRAEDFLPREAISPRLVQPAQAAIGLLRDLKAGNSNTYQSWSLHDQIGFYDDLIARVAQVLGA